MEHYRLRKYRGPEVWARVRRAYEAGESGPSVARRFDVGLANLRKKVRREGWSRRDQAERLDLELAGERIATAAADADTGPVATTGARPDPTAEIPGDRRVDGPVDRQAALAACLDHAAVAMARGEGHRALAELRAALAFTELTRRLVDPGVIDPTEPGRLRALAFLRGEGEGPI